MTTPVLHLIAGSNGAGKSEFAKRVLLPVTHLPFVNADLIAEELWPGDRNEQQSQALVVSRLAAAERERRMTAGESFVTETVFSHPSKVELINQAQNFGYNVWLHVMLVPADLSVQRVIDRVANGGHQVPESKVRARYERLWGLVAQAVTVTDRAVFYDNSKTRRAFRKVATFERGALLGSADWPTWTPSALL